MRSLTLFCLSFIALIAAACSSPAAATPTPTPEPTDFERILALVPDTPTSRAMTRINNYSEIATELGIPVPGGGASFEQVLDYRSELVRSGRQDGFPRIGGEWLSGIHRDYALEIQDTSASLGFDSRHVELSAVTGEEITGGSDRLTEVVIGQIDGQRATALLDSCGSCGEVPDAVSYAGRMYYTWGPQQNLRLTFEEPLFDFVGRGGSLYFEDGIGVRTRQSEDIEAVIDTVSESTSSLADLEEWVIASRALEELEAHSAVFTERTDTMIEDWPTYVGLAQAPPENFEPEIIERLDMFDQITETVRSSSALLPPFDLVASGTGWENGRAYSALAVVFADEQTAQQAAEALRDRAETGLTIGGALETMPWSDMIESSQIEARGRVVTAKIFAVEPEERSPSPLRLFLTAVPFATDVPYVQFLLR